MNKRIEWSKQKSELLRNKYGRKGVDFEQCSALIEAGKVLDVKVNPNPKFSHQKMFVLEIRNYIYLVPYVEDDEKIFLKTVYPNRKNTEIYLRKEKKWKK